MEADKCSICGDPLVRLSEGFLGCAVLGHGGLRPVPPAEQRVDRIRAENAETNRKIREAFKEAK